MGKLRRYPPPTRLDTEYSFEICVSSLGPINSIGCALQNQSPLLVLLFNFTANSLVFGTLTKTDRQRERGKGNERKSLRTIKYLLQALDRNNGFVMSSSSSLGYQILPQGSSGFCFFHFFVSSSVRENRKSRVSLHCVTLMVDVVVGECETIRLSFVMAAFRGHLGP